MAWGRYRVYCSSHYMQSFTRLQTGTAMMMRIAMIIMVMVMVMVVTIIDEEEERFNS